jgi:hypothetical protein
MDGKGFDCFKSYLSLCSPFRFAAPWDCLPADPAAYRGPSSPENAIEHLAERHSEPDLIASGLVRKGENNALAIHPSLTEPNMVVLALRQCASNGVTNLVTNNGCVHGGTLPLFASLHDCATSKAPTFNGKKDLFLTGSLDDAIVLRSLGMAATPVVGLNNIGSRELKQLCKHVGLERWSKNALERDAACQAHLVEEARRTSRDSSQSSVPRTAQSPAAKRDEQSGQCVELAFVNWSLSKLSLASPAPIASALEHLTNLNRFCGLEVCNILEMRPCTSGGRPSTGRLNVSPANNGRETPVGEYLKVINQIVPITNRLLK